MFEKILIANRGEIAVRIARTCRRLGIRTVAVYSEIDARSQHVQAADEAVCIGLPSSDQSYLAQEKIIAAALDHGCAAVHPGYGFLSENPIFAEKVARAGLVFIGPPAPAIAALGDKVAAKALAVQAEVPVVPGIMKPAATLDEALAGAEEIGFPVLLKPAAGGGGKGMRIVAARDELAAAMQAGRAETRKAFGDDRVFVEKYVPVARHVEIQVIADRHGAVIHLGERECSLQRRYQKIVEESPSVAVDAELRRRMGACACRLAQAAGYTNAGTVEFILDPEGRFYFLEMNTRLQVEHPVTELVTGLDLVELQLRVAAGEPLPLRQADVAWKGWAVEARICAEDPARGFLPSTGMITRYSPAQGANIRLDSGVGAGSLVSAYYDSLLAKVIAWGETRQNAIGALVRALNGYHIEGIATNVDFVNAVLTHPEFAAGNLSTGFIETHFEKGLPKAAAAPGAAAFHGHGGHDRLSQPAEPHARVPEAHGGPGRRGAGTPGLQPLHGALPPGCFRALPAQGPAAARVDRHRRRTDLRGRHPGVRILPPAAPAQDQRPLPHVPPVLPVQLLRGRLLRHGAHLRGVRPPRVGAGPAHAGRARRGPRKRPALPDAGAGGGGAREKGRPRLPRPGPGQHRIHEDGKLRRLALRRRGRGGAGGSRAGGGGG